MALGKQAKVLSEEQIAAALIYVNEHGRFPARDRARILLSVKAGLRAKEISCATWAMVTDAEGKVADTLQLPNRASKGKGGGRIIPLHRDLKAALMSLAKERHPRSEPGDPIVFSTVRSSGILPAAMAVWFHRLYKGLGFDGASSHSGRRTFITRAARAIVKAGGSLRDVQILAGHRSLNTTERYIAADSAAQRRVVEMI
jgi:integrase/recombinase XerD